MCATQMKVWTGNARKRTNCVAAGLHRTSCVDPAEPDTHVELRSKAWAGCKATAPPDKIARRKLDFIDSLLRHCRPVTRQNGRANEGKQKTGSDKSAPCRFSNHL